MCNGEDPEYDVYWPILSWLDTEAGKWCQDTAGSLHYTMAMEVDQRGYIIEVFARMTEQEYLFYKLKFNAK